MTRCPLAGGRVGHDSVCWGRRVGGDTGRAGDFLQSTYTVESLTHGENVTVQLLVAGVTH
jgi:hypothetical protein